MILGLADQLGEPLVEIIDQTGEQRRGAVRGVVTLARPMVLHNL